MPINLPDLRLGLKQVNTGLAPNDGQGEDLRSAFDKVNFNTNILANMVGEALTNTKDYWVSTSGVDTNNGLTEGTAFRTISKAVSTIYKDLKLSGQQATINLMPGDYVESILINGLPDGAYGVNAPIRIRKAAGQAGTVYWSFNPANHNYALRISGGARVLLDGIHFRTSVPGSLNAGKHLIDVLSSSSLWLGSCEFALMGATTLNDAVHIYVYNDSELQLQKAYTIKGGGTTHIYVGDGSKVWSPPSTGDPKICTLDGTVEFREFIQVRGRSDVQLSADNIQYQGNLQGRQFNTDIFSTVQLGVNLLPNSAQVGTYEQQSLNGSLTFLSPTTMAASLSVLGTSSFQGAMTVSGQATFSNTTNFTSAVSLTGITTASAPPNDDNSGRVATTGFVQQVVQDKILAAVGIATPALFGLVKIDGADADPIVYRKVTVDTLLGLKANLASPTFTGEPKAPTPSSADNSTNLATTAWVRNYTAGISSMPTGAILPFAGPTTAIPSGWLLCDGAYVSRTTYATLFTAIGTRWGSTSESNFRLPLLTDRGLMGAAADENVGQLSGSASVTLTTPNLPAHTHNVIDPGHVHSTTDPGHAHGISDPGHVHGVFDPGHSHVVTTPIVTTGLNPPNLLWEAWSNPGAGAYGSATAVTALTGIYIDRAWTGITINGALSNLSINASGTGITLQNTGSGQSFSVINPHGKVHWIIKA
ncbi:phage tail collar family protein [Leptolyngbyaceae cyanobacterium JSC-12]|nr:phage tail collar family protein [Leptolyngbyaceae cyanobacterium JSC-12]